MAQYDVTAQAATLTTAGWTTAQIEAIHPDIRHDAPRKEWLAWNRSSQQAIYTAAERVKPKTDRTATAKQISYLTALGGTAAPGMSMAAASAAIEGLKAHRDPAAEALRIGRSYGVNGQIWDNA